MVSAIAVVVDCVSLPLDGDPQRLIRTLWLLYMCAFMKWCSSTSCFCVSLQITCIYYAPWAQSNELCKISWCRKIGVPYILRIFGTGTIFCTGVNNFGGDKYPGRIRCWIYNTYGSTYVDSTWWMSTKCGTAWKISTSTRMAAWKSFQFTFYNTIDREIFVVKNFSLATLTVPTKIKHAKY